MIDPACFDKAKVKSLAAGVKVTVGHVRGSRNRWEIISYLFLKAEGFKSHEQVRAWLTSHVQKETDSIFAFASFNEYRRRMLKAYINNSTLK